VNAREHKRRDAAVKAVAKIAAAKPKRSDLLRDQPFVRREVDKALRAAAEEIEAVIRTGSVTRAKLRGAFSRARASRDGVFVAHETPQFPVWRQQWERLSDLRLVEEMRNDFAISDARHRALTHLLMEHAALIAVARSLSDFVEG
jgi:hypothetical protein